MSYIVNEWRRRALFEKKILCIALEHVWRVPTGQCSHPYALGDNLPFSPRSGSSPARSVTVVLVVTENGESRTGATWLRVQTISKIWRSTKTWKGLRSARTPFSFLCQNPLVTHHLYLLYCTCTHWPTAWNRLPTYFYRNRSSMHNFSCWPEPSYLLTERTELEILCYN